MAKYRVDTDKGSYMVETEDAPASVPGMEKLGGAAPPAPKMPGIGAGRDAKPIPADLDQNYSAPSSFQNPRTGRIGTNRAPGNADPLTNFVDAPVGGVSQMGEGVEQMSNPHPRPGNTPGTMNPPTPTQQIAGGASKVIRGAMKTSTPLLPGAIVAAPGAVIGGMVAGTGAGKVAHAGLKAAGTSDEVADLGEDVAGLTVGGAVAKKVSGGALTEAKNSVADRFARDPVDSMTRALKPKSTNIGFKDNLARSMPELKATETETGKPISNLADLLASVKTAKQRVWGQYEAMAGPQANAQLDMSSVADAMASTIPERTQAQNPGTARAITAKADTYRRPMTIRQAEDNLKHVNAELDAYFDQYPTARRTALDKNPATASLNAEGQALRKVIYGWIDQDNGGAAPRELKQRYGSLMNLEEEAYRRQNVADRQQPDSLSEQVGKVRAAGHFVKGLVTGSPVDMMQGLAESKVATWLKEQQTTDALIRDAFARFKGLPAPVNVPPPFQPKGLLAGPNQPNSRTYPPGGEQHQTGGTMYTPPPADTSFVRGTQGMTQPPNPARAITQGDIQLGPNAQSEPITKQGHYANAPNPRRALPPATTIISPKYAPPDAPKPGGTTPKTTLPPAMDGSYVRSVPATVAKSLSDAILDQQEQK